MSSYRQQSSCMAIGHAAGVGAALAAMQGRPVADVEAAAVRQQLLQQDAILE